MSYRVRWTIGQHTCYASMTERGMLVETTHIEQAAPVDRQCAEVLAQMIQARRRVTPEIVEA